jgi:transposase
MKRYRVTLSDDEREELGRLLRRGKGDVRVIKHAQMLLKADEVPGSPGWDDARIAEALGVGIATVPRLRQRFVEEGFAAALRSYRKGSRRYKTALDGRAEAHLIAVACSAPPRGHGRWTCRLLAQKMVELQHVPQVSHETVRKRLKKMNLSLT